MKKLIFVTMLLHFVQIGFSQLKISPYDKAPVVESSVIQGFKSFSGCKGKLNNYGDKFQTNLITQLFYFDEEDKMDFVDFKVYWQGNFTKQLKFVAHGKVRTVFRFSTWLKEPGVYWCIFIDKKGVEKMILIDASTKNLQIQLADKCQESKTKRI